jgi:hypothetical protein
MPCQIFWDGEDGGDESEESDDGMSGFKVWGTAEGGDNDPTADCDA